MINRQRVRRAAVPLAVSALAASAFAVTAAGPAAAATVPNAPSGLAATYGSGIVALAWADNSADETGFEVERCTRTTTTCTFAPLGTALANQYLFADQSPLGPYRYRVRAVNGAGASAWSAEAALPTGLGGYPTAVLTAAPVGGGAPLDVTFDGSASTWIEFQTITSYSWSFGDGATASGPTVSHVYTAPGSYRATLTVANAAGVANLASTTIAVTASAPPAPTGLTATSTVKRRVDLRWSNPAGSTATSLRVSRCTGSTCSVLSTVAQLPPTATSWSDTTVRSGTTYRYIVTAENAAGASSVGPVTVKAR